MRRHVDHRATRYCALFEGQFGDTNLFVVKPGQRTYWHRHAGQDDQFLVIKGAVKFGWWRERQKPRYQTLRGPIDGTVTVPRGTWHGYANISEREDAWLLMYLSRPFDPTDEEKREDVPWPE